MKIRVLTLTMMATALAFGLSTAACGGGEGEAGGSKLARALTKVTGRLAPQDGSLPKVSALIGSGTAKKLVNAVVDPETREFRLDDLPEGTKSLLVEHNGETRTVKFNVNKVDPSNVAGAIAETNLTGDTLDLGEVALNDTGEHYVAEHNPYATIIDTDLDGQRDFEDDDIDGDGVPNEQEDSSLFGDEWEEYMGWGWGWGDAYVVPGWDCNGNYVADWEEGYYDASCWQTDWSSYWADSYWTSSYYQSCTYDAYGNVWCEQATFDGSSCYYDAYGYLYCDSYMSDPYGYGAY